MSIATAIQNAQQRVADAYTAISNKGGTLPATQNLANMPTAIDSIQTGGTINSLTIVPTTSSQTITASGGVDGYSPITVNAVTSSIDSNISAGNIKSGVTILGVTGTLSGGYPELPSYQVVNGVASKRSGALTGDEFLSITSIDDYGLYNTFYEKNSLTGSVNFTNLTTIGNYGLYNTFYNCTSLNGTINFSNVISIGTYGLGYVFYGCNGLTGGVNLSSLVTIGNHGLYNAFYNCTSLNGTVNLRNVMSISEYGLSYAFYKCEKLTGSINFSSVSSIGRAGMNNAFSSCKKISSIYFNSLKTTSFGSYVNQFSNMFDSNTASTSGTCTVHFPSNLQSAVSGLTGYPAFGGNSSRIVLAFDLPATS